MIRKLGTCVEFSVMRLTFWSTMPGSPSESPPKKPRKTSGPQGNEPSRVETDDHWFPGGGLPQGSFQYLVFSLGVSSIARMQVLRERILELGYVLPGDILNVNAILNHQLDTRLLVQIGEAFAERFGGLGVTKILTIETSGIAAAVTTGVALQVPVVFARTTPTPTIGNDHYQARAYSYTKQVRHDVIVARPFISPDDRLLIVDDFLARGEAVSALTSIIDQASASLAGIGIIIEKAFQEGGEKLRAAGHEVFALARIKSLSPPKHIEFVD